MDHSNLIGSQLSERTRTLLVVDDDPKLLALMRRWLDRRGFNVICTETSKAAWRTASVTNVDLALVDFRLRGKEDGLSLGSALAREHGIPFILFSGFLSTAVIVQAMRLGAREVLDKPLTAERVVRAVSEILEADSDSRPIHQTLSDEAGLLLSREDDSVAERLARLVLRGSEAKRDPKKVALFARAAVVSPAVFRAVCKLCEVRPRDACDLGRLLRALALSTQDNSPIVSHLSVGDGRTARSLMERAGLDSEARRVELREFLHRQRFVDPTLEFVRELGHLAANSPLFFPAED